MSRDGEIASTREFSRVCPPLGHFKAHHEFREACKLVPHEYRKAYFWKNVGTALATAVLVLVSAVFTLIGALWYPFRRVYVGLLDCFRRQKPSPGEKDVLLATVREDGVEKLFITLLTPEDIKRQGLPSEAILGWLKEKNPVSGSPFTPDNFVTNLTFIMFFQDVVSRRGCEDPELAERARGASDGDMGMILDRRREGAADIVREDLIGTFEIHGGQLVAESYQPNEFYEVVSKDGLMTLDRWLRGVLLEEIRKLPAVPD